MSFYSNRSVEPAQQIARTGIIGRGRVKQVFQYPQLAHVWAQQTQEHGRSPKGQMYFHGDTIFSYGSHYPIARFAAPGLVLFNSEKNSNTTEGHKACVRNALRGLPGMRVFYVPHVTATGIHGSDYHARNADYLAGQFAEHVKQACRAHAVEKENRRLAYYGHDTRTPESALAYRLEQIPREAETVAAYCAAFGVDVPASVDAPAAQEKVRAAFARYFAPKAIARREAKRAAKPSALATVGTKVAAYLEGVIDTRPRLKFISHYDKQAIARVFGFDYYYRFEDNLRAVENRRFAEARGRKRKTVTEAEWLDGKGNANQPFSATLVRRKGDTLQTSRGAECPFAHAVAAFLKAQECKRNGATWQCNGESIRVGVFNVDRIDESGGINAGCHRIEFDAMQSLAVREVPHLVKPAYGLPALIV